MTKKLRKIAVPKLVVEQKAEIFGEKIHETTFYHKCLFLIHEIIYLKCLYSQKNRFHEECYTEIPAVEIESALGSRYYKEVIDFLCEKGVIELSPKYYNRGAGYARGYRVSERFDSKLVLVEIKVLSVYNYIEKKRSNAKYRGNRRRLSGGSKETGPTDNQLLEEVHTLEIRDLNEEESRACKYLESYKYIYQNMARITYSDEFYQVLETIRPKRQRTKNQNADSVSNNRAQMVVYAMKGEIDTTYKYDSRCGRYYYPMVRLRKELRELIEIDGKKVCEVDISSSQPYAAQVLYDDVDLDHELIVKVMRIIYNKLPPEDKKQIKNAFKGINNDELRKIEIKRWLIIQERDKLNKVIRSEAGFYKYIYEIEKGKDAPWDQKIKGRIKKRYLSELFYGAPEQRRDGWGAFKYEFPILACMIHLTFKPSEKVKKDNEYNGNGYLSMRLQAIEADIIFSVVEKLRVEGIICYTVHDSIIVEEQYAEYVKSKIISAGRELIRFEPVVSIK